MVDVLRYPHVSEEETVDWGNSDEASLPVIKYLKALEESDTEGNTQKTISLTDPKLSWTDASGPSIGAEHCVVFSNAHNAMLQR